MQSKREAFWRGTLAPFSTAVFVLFLAFIGFGALASETGFSLLQAIFTTATVFALPGQVILADQVGQGSSLGTIMLAVTLTAVRLLPLTLSLMPLLVDKDTPKWLSCLMVHFIAVTIWVESITRLPEISRDFRTAFFLGCAFTLFVGTLLGTFIGFTLANFLSREFLAGLLILTPIYFFLSLIQLSSHFMNRAAIAFGVILGPLFFILWPGLDLLLTGLIGGSLAYGWTRWKTL